MTLMVKVINKTKELWDLKGPLFLLFSRSHSSAKKNIIGLVTFESKWSEWIPVRVVKRISFIVQFKKKKRTQLTQTIVFL